MLRRLHPDQPASFAFTPANQAWAQAQITKYPEGRQASAIIPLLWRAQEQEGWLTRPAIEHIAEMLGMAYIRALEVATFYFMFQLQPVGSVAHFQVCGTLSCMICGAEKLIEVCRQKIAPRAHMLSADGKFSWEEVECLGACANAPMVQIGKDYYEDLTAEGFAQLIDDLAAGKVPTAGPQNGRFSSEPLGGATTLKDYTGEAQNGSVALATRIGDTIKRIDGTEVPLLTPWQDKPVAADKRNVTAKSIKDHEPKPARNAPADETGVAKQQAQATTKGKPKAMGEKAADNQPEMLTAPKGKADDLKKLKGVGPKLEGVLNELGVYHFWQVASWTPDDVAWVDERLKFKGRIERDGWIEQARILADGGETEFSKRAK
ncbi:NADH-quinone oxidoreductase subunit E [Roseinatronobacter alkalisoli]|uniref:NADH-quinone oxidoreductase subunit E n=1 Tax=Roseinatronobacter alkalisoli TaxID=3028235 RepID=A0ABT5T5Y4_9RHOB|nr:NADH-quinone oxidoreductase subunit E [Roseinatronobacter sp. HJB301]MDD7970130.1 NADH-quinone oxidoreductase subunit E [Roseinatronobacter sp. HJB301]